MSSKINTSTISKHQSGVESRRDGELVYHNMFPQPLILDSSSETVILNGYVIPVLVLITVVTNTLVCFTLLRKELRSATNLLLVAMAASDTLTGLLPTPMYLYFYSTGRHNDWVPHSVCFLYLCLTDYFPTMTHTASIWLTVALAFHRYLCVCPTFQNFPTVTISGAASAIRTFMLKKNRRIRQIVCVILIIYAASIASHLNRLFELKFYSAPLKSRLSNRDFIGKTKSTGQLFASKERNTNNCDLVYQDNDINEMVNTLNNSNFSEINKASIPGPVSATVYAPVQYNSKYSKNCENLDLSDLSKKKYRAKFRDESFSKIRQFYLSKSKHLLSRRDVSHMSSVTMTTLIRQRDDIVNACKFDFVPLVKNNLSLYFNVYYWMRITWIHVVPCFALVILNGLLIKTMRAAAARKAVLRHQSRGRVERNRLSESNSTTLMLIIVVGVMLLVELPMAILFGITVLENTYHIIIISKESTRLGTIIVNCLILLSYPINFFIYCATSRQFRHSFCMLFKRQNCQNNSSCVTYQFTVNNGRLSSDKKGLKYGITETTSVRQAMEARPNSLETSGVITLTTFKTMSQ